VTKWANCLGRFWSLSPASPRCQLLRGLSQYVFFSTSSLLVRFLTLCPHCVLIRARLRLSLLGDLQCWFYILLPPFLMATQCLLFLFLFCLLSASSYLKFLCSGRSVLVPSSPASSFFPPTCPGVRIAVASPNPFFFLRVFFSSSPLPYLMGIPN